MLRQWASMGPWGLGLQGARVGALPHLPQGPQSWPPSQLDNWGKYRPSCPSYLCQKRLQTQGWGDAPLLPTHTAGSLSCAGYQPPGLPTFTGPRPLGGPDGEPVLLWALLRVGKGLISMQNRNRRLRKHHVRSGGRGAAQQAAGWRRSTARGLTRVEVRAEGEAGVEEGGKIASRYNMYLSPSLLLFLLLLLLPSLLPLPLFLFYIFLLLPTPSFSFFFLNAIILLFFGKYKIR